VNKELMIDKNSTYQDTLITGHSFIENTNDWLSETIGVSTVQARLLVAVVEIDDIGRKMEHPYDEISGNDFREILDKVIHFVQEHHIGICCKTADHRIAILLDDTKQQFYEKMEQLVAHVKERTPYSITVGLGTVVSCPMELASSYRYARESLEYKMFQGKGKVVRKKRSTSLLSSDSFDLDNEVRRLISVLAAYELNSVSGFLDKTFHFINGFDCKETVYNFMIQLVTKIDTHLQTMNESFYSLLGWNFQNLNQLYRFETVDDIRNWLNRVLFEIAELLFLKGQKKHFRLTQEIKRYIEDRKDMILTVSDVSEAFSFSSSYLGALFKEETGVNLIDYLIAKRMERVREMLLDPTLRVYEIADRTGYKNITHFNRQFKAMFGVTPTDYRKQSGA
jgi:two-component system response regulator YesN